MSDALMLTHLAHTHKVLYARDYSTLLAIGTSTEYFYFYDGNFITENPENSLARSSPTSSRVVKTSKHENFIYVGLELLT